MCTQYDIMVAGHICIDIIPSFYDTGAAQISELFRPGKLVIVKGASISTGGPVSNTGINMKTLGSSVCFCARVGDDELGRLTRDMIARSGSAEGIKLSAGSDSSYTVAIAPPNIDRIFLHNPGTNDLFSPDDLDPELIAQCRQFHFGYPPLMRRLYEHRGDELRKVFEIAQNAGATTSCDMTLPDPDSKSGRLDWHEILANILPFIDIFVPSVEETLYMVDPSRFLEMKKRHQDVELIDFLTEDDYSELADQVLDMGAGIVTLKSGHRGFYVKTAPAERLEAMGRAKPGNVDNWADRQLWAPAWKVDKLASATGSGDSAIAGFLSAFLRGLDIEVAIRYAVCCGWQNVQVLDAVSGIADWKHTTEMVNKDMPTIDVNITSKDWKWSRQHRVWAGPGDPLN